MNNGEFLIFQSHTGHVCKEEPRVSGAEGHKGRGCLEEREDKCPPNITAVLSKRLKCVPWTNDRQVTSNFFSNRFFLK